MSEDLPALLAVVVAVGVHVFAGLLLASAGVAKWADRPDFERTLAAYRLLPPWLVGPTAMVLPMAEIGTGLSLIVLAAPAAIAAAVLLALFAAAMAINLLRGRTDLACGCGSGGTIGWRLVAVNLSLGALLLLTSRLPIDAAPLVLGIGAFLIRRIGAVLAALPPLRQPSKWSPS